MVRRDDKVLMLARFPLPALIAFAESREPIPAERQCHGTRGFEDIGTHCFLSHRLFYPRSCVS